MACLAPRPCGGDPALLDTLPLLGDVLPLMPGRIKAKLFDAFDLQVIYTKTISQVTLRATVTTTTRDTPRAIIAASETPDLQRLLDHWSAPSDLARHPGAGASPMIMIGRAGLAASSWWAVQPWGLRRGRVRRAALPGCAQDDDAQ